MITISGEPKEIAALVAALQERRKPKLLGFDETGHPITDRNTESNVKFVFDEQDRLQ